MQPKCSAGGVQCSAVQHSSPSYSWVGRASVPSGDKTCSKPRGTVGRPPPKGATFALFGDIYYKCFPCRSLRQPIPTVFGRRPNQVSDSCKKKQNMLLFLKRCQSSDAEMQKQPMKMKNKNFLHCLTLFTVHFACKGLCLGHSQALHNEVQ